MQTELVRILGKSWLYFQVKMYGYIEQCEQLDFVTKI